MRTSFHPYLLLVLSLLLAVIVLCTLSCRKPDMPFTPSEAQPLSQTESKFFNSHRSGDGKEKALVDFFKRRNDSSHFVEKTVERIGYPRWDKAISGKESNTYNRFGNNEATITYIPFARDNENYVNAVMQVKTTSTDTSFNYLCDWQYRETFSSPADTSFRALKFFLLFAGHDKRVFGHNQFKLKDNRILQSVSDTLLKANKQYMLELVTNQNQLELLVAPNPELPHSSCLMIYDMISAGFVVDYYKVGKVCVLESYYFPVSTSGGGAGGSGGGNQPPDDTPPTCHEPVGRGIAGRPFDPCGPGWKPLPTDDPPLPQEPVDSMLARYSRGINGVADSLRSLGNGNNIEYFFAVVSNNGVIDTQNVKNDGAKISVKPNYYVYNGRVLLGGWHNHPNNHDGSPGSGPSGDDVAQLYNKPNRFVVFIDCSNKRYALVVENNSLSNAWFRIPGNGPNVLYQKVNNLVYSDPRVWSPAEFQKMTVEKIMQVLGSSTSSGIGLYESTNSERTTFIKKN